MAENITIKVPGKHQQTGEYGADEFKSQRIDIDELAMPFLIHGRGMGTSLTHIPSGYRITPFDGVAEYGSLPVRLHAMPVINQITDSARCSATPYTWNAHLQAA